MSTYLATVNVPGSMPTDDDPPTFETAREAWEYLAGERMRAENKSGYCHDPMHDEPCPLPCTACEVDDCGYSETFQELASLGRKRSIGPSLPGTVSGPTPGLVGDHDLGLVYSVTKVED